jgi:hypothetical protein
LGCYFNDAGINPMHDEFFSPMGPEAPAILKVAKEEGPDLAVSLHSHGSKPALLRPAYVTMEKQEDIRQLAAAYYAILQERGLPHGALFDPKAGAIYHVSGASSFTFECPHGLSTDRACKVEFEEILDIQLVLYEAMMKHTLAKKTPFARVIAKERSNCGNLNTYITQTSRFLGRSATAGPIP